ncbi:hypothetical protein ACGFNP_01115 [Nonomuraea sp. NPDC049269]|uniref:hypothetical protein n=1 Tax=Nonomuraea sp. NPDC049269 TaxID=3364349 RepID=UPI003711B41C
MRYVLMLCSDVSDETVAGQDPDMVGCGGWTEDMESRGARRGCGPAAMRPRCAYGVTRCC